MTGGTHGLEQNQFGTLVVNGGTFKGVMGYGIRMTGGIAYINGGSVTGNFGGIEHEDGVVVLNGGEVKSVRQTEQRPPQKRGLVKGGVFTGSTVLEDVVLSVDDLTVASGSSIKVTRGGGLNVTNSFVNNGTFTFTSGLQSIGGEAVIKPDIQGNHTPVNIYFGTSFRALTYRKSGSAHRKRRNSDRHRRVFQRQDSSVEVERRARLLGSIDHKGRADGVPELDAGGGDSGRDFVRRRKLLCGSRRWDCFRASSQTRTAA